MPKTNTYSMYPPNAIKPATWSTHQWTGNSE